MLSYALLLSLGRNHYLMHDLQCRRFLLGERCIFFVGLGRANENAFCRSPQLSFVGARLIKMHSLAMNTPVFLAISLLFENSYYMV